MKNKPFLKFVLTAYATLAVLGFIDGMRKEAKASKSPDYKY
jgi:hypothetical protein